MKKNLSTEEQNRIEQAMNALKKQSLKDAELEKIKGGWGWNGGMTDGMNCPE